VVTSHVHFASGPHRFPAPWINVDFSAEADVKADLLEPLPDAISGIEVAYVGHFLEHLTPDEGVEFLARIRERMVPRGRIVVVGPDVAKSKVFFDAGLISRDLFACIKTHGKPLGSDGHDRQDCHLWDCTGIAVVTQLSEAGWRLPHEFPIASLPLRHPDVPMINASGWQFAASAKA
jgi:hypothetical protein